MVSVETSKALTQLSCVLSLIGASLVAFTWAYPRENRLKHGRILLLWLSFADFMSSLFYLLQTFGWNSNRNFCETTALIDIFFPVASFIWTDFIAYYLYLVVRRRSESYVFNWKRLLFSFHVIAWSVSLLTVLLVLLFGHAGADPSDGTDDAGAADTAGWCWIKAGSDKERFLWELIGGKLIEWTSGLIIVPYLYISVANQLYQIDAQQFPSAEKNSLGDRVARSAQQGRPLQTPLLHPSKFGMPKNESNTNLSAAIYSEHDDLDQVYRPTNEVVDLSGSQQSQQFVEEVVDIENNQPNAYPPQRIGAIIDEEDLELSFDEQQFQQNNLNSSHHGTEVSMKSGAARRSSAGSTMPRQSGPPNSGNSGGGSRAYFSKFYVKLFALPIVFIFIRLWSSLRVILAGCGAIAASKNDFLTVMQAFFDPSQGFFNALLFVLFSPEDRQRLSESLFAVVCFICDRISHRLCGVYCCRACITRVSRALPKIPKSISSASLHADLHMSPSRSQMHSGDAILMHNTQFSGQSDRDVRAATTQSNTLRNAQKLSEELQQEQERTKVEGASTTMNILHSQAKSSGTNNTSKPGAVGKTSNTTAAPANGSSKKPTSSQQKAPAATTKGNKAPAGDPHRRSISSAASSEIDIEDDFECSDGNRLSDYSFDGRADSDSFDSPFYPGTSLGSSSSHNNGGLFFGSPSLTAGGNLPPHIQALQQLHQLQTLQQYSASRSASRSLSQSMSRSPNIAGFHPGTTPSPGPQSATSVDSSSHLNHTKTNNINNNNNRDSGNVNTTLSPSSAATSAGTTAPPTSAPAPTQGDGGVGQTVDREEGGPRAFSPSSTASTVGSKHQQGMDFSDR